MKAIIVKQKAYVGTGRLRYVERIVVPENGLAISFYEDRVVAVLGFVINESCTVLGEVQIDPALVELGEEYARAREKFMRHSEDFRTLLIIE